MFSKPFIKEAKIDQLDDMNQKRIGKHDSCQEPIKFRVDRDHPKGGIKPWNIRNSQDDATDKSGRGNDGEGGSRLYEW